MRVDLGVTGALQSPDGSGDQALNRIEGVIGSPFADKLIGSTGPDAIDGGAGADTIEGNAGADRLSGGAGIDAIDSRDSSPDSISCGEGPDGLATDALDTLAADCIPAATSGGALPASPASPAGVAPVLAVTIPRQSLRTVRARGLRVLLRCTKTCRAGGRVAIARPAARRLGLTRRAARRAGRLAATDLAVGATVESRVRLSRRARNSLRGVHRARLVLRARAVDGAGLAAAPVRRTVRLRAR